MMLPKIILLDADGVVLKKHAEYFSEKFAREHDAPSDELKEFFKGPYKLCQTGKADLKEELKDRLSTWGWDKPVEEFLEFWFSEDVVLDQEVLALAQDLHAKGIQCYLATDQEKYRKAYIQQLLDGQLDGYFISCDLGFTKSQPEFFQAVLQKLGATPADVAYFDDDQQNVDTARSVGIDAHFFISIEDLKKYE